MSSSSTPHPRNNALSAAQILEDDNDRKLHNLAPKIQSLRQISEQIEIQVRDSNRLLDDLDSGMGNVQNFLKNTIGMVGKLKDGASSKHLMYLVLFVVAVFLFLYYWLGRV